MNNNLKIAIYSGEIPSTTFIERLIKGLSEKGHNIYLFGVKKQTVSYPKSIKVLGYKHSKLLKALYLLKYWFLLIINKPKSKNKLDVLLKQSGRNNLYSKVKYYPILYHQPQIFHIQWAKGLSEWLWVQDFGIKLVLSLRGAHINYSPIANPDLAKMYKDHFPKIDGFHAVSKAIAQEAMRYNAQGDKIKVVYSGLDLKPKHSLMPDRDSPIFKIISVGRSHWIKGYTYALDCCSILKKAGFNFEYTIVGGNDSIEMKYHLKDLDLEEEVKLLGTLPFSKVKEKVENSNLLLLPSIKEGIANVVLEAMAIGVPVLTTDCGGITEIVIDEVNGFICPTRNPKAMAKKIEEINNKSKEYLTTIINNAKDSISKHHTIENMVSEMESFYNLVSN